MINLTSEERKALLFLCALALLGISTKAALTSLSPSRSLTSLHSNIGKVNLNRADKATLMLIPGIGKTLAQRIIDYRIGHGDFSEIEELRKIAGLGASKYETIKDLVYIP